MEKKYYIIIQKGDRSRWGGVTKEKRRDNERREEGVSLCFIIRALPPKETRLTLFLGRESKFMKSILYSTYAVKRV